LLESNVWSESCRPSSQMFTGNRTQEGYTAG
jgi:hypothetical protein